MWRVVSVLSVEYEALKNRPMGWRTMIYVRFFNTDELRDESLLNKNHCMIRCRNRWESMNASKTYLKPNLAGSTEYPKCFPEPV